MKTSTVARKFLITTTGTVLIALGIGETGIKVPLEKGDLGGSRTFCYQ